MHATLSPGQAVPALSVRKLGGGELDIAAQSTERFLVVLFYRGVHCPICKTQLGELNKKIDKFRDDGHDVIGVSMDSEDRADRQAVDWEIDNLTIGYGMSEASAREWGLYISRKEKDAEPDRFNEPAVAVIRPDGTLYAWFLQSVPFARPSWDDLLQALNFVIEKDYPIRGTLAA